MHATFPHVTVLLAHRRCIVVQQSSSKAAAKAWANTAVYRCATPQPPRPLLYNTLFPSRSPYLLGGQSEAFGALPM